MVERICFVFLSTFFLSFTHNFDIFLRLLSFLYLKFLFIYFASSYKTSKLLKKDTRDRKKTILVIYLREYIANITPWSPIQDRVLPQPSLAHFKMKYDFCLLHQMSLIAPSSFESASFYLLSVLRYCSLSIVGSSDINKSKYKSYFIATILSFPLPKLFQHSGSNIKSGCKHNLID